MFVETVERQHNGARIEFMYEWVCVRKREKERERDRKKEKGKNKKMQWYETRWG